jgi:hypothetical protein
MNKETEIIFKSYEKILENANISNNSTSDVSTKFTTDHMARFLPIGQDDEEKKNRDPYKELKQKLQNFFTSIKALTNQCQSKNCKSSDVAKLIDLMNNPEAQNDLEELKKAIQLMDQENGNNTKLSSL